MADTIQLTCTATGKVVNTKATPTGMPRLPKGWKRVNDAVYSPEAWKSQYALRAIVVPVVCPAVPDGAGPQSETMKAAWKDFDAKMKLAWEYSTEAANWALRRLLANDVTRERGTTKCPKMPEIYLYGERDWTGWSQSAASVLRTVEQSYRARRYEVVWTGGQSLPNVRYPYPFPVHNAGWKLEISEGGRPVFEARLPDGRVQLCLKGGAEYRRQLAGMKWLIAHPELRGEASLYRRGDKVVVKMVGWFPRNQTAELDGTMFVRTSTTEFLVGLNAKDERLFLIPGDRAREWLARQRNGLQRWHDGMKMELRKPKRASRKNMQDMQRSAKKCRDRINSFIDETAAQIVNHAARRKLARIAYDDTVRTYFQDFQWYRLELLLKQKASAAGIEFERCGAAENTATSRNSVSSEVEQ